MAAKTYPLEIHNVGDHSYMVMSKGHHEPDEFMKQVREEGYEWPLGNPKHVYVKATPCNTEENISNYTIVEKGTRGAFPATYSYEACGDELYQAPETK